MTVRFMDSELRGAIMQLIAVEADVVHVLIVPV